MSASATRAAAEAPAETAWLDLDSVAAVNVIVGGRRVARAPGTWSADAPGEQTIDIQFRQPQAVSHLRIVCSETEHLRTQEMTIWATFEDGAPHHELLRQQFTFSPGGAHEEVEEYRLDLQRVSGLQLRIVPSIDGRPAVARVDDLQLAAPRHSRTAAFEWRPK